MDMPNIASQKELYRKTVSKDRINVTVLGIIMWFLRDGKAGWTRKWVRGPGGGLMVAISKSLWEIDNNEHETTIAYMSH